MTREEAIARALSEYQSLRADEARDRDRRVGEIRERDPGIARLLDENAGLFSRSARAVMEDRLRAGEIAGELRARVEKNQAQIRARLQALGLPEDALSLRFACRFCRDTGYRGEDRRTFCACMEKRIARLCGEGPDIPPEHAFDRFDPGVYPDEAQRTQGERALEICRAYAQGLPDGQPLNLLLMGESGLGKTFLLDATARLAQQKNVSVLRRTSFQALEAMRAYHFGENGEGSAFHRMLNAPLLTIDDLGTEPMLRNITVEYLFTLLNERMAARLHTAVATNLQTQDLIERYGERVLSRLMDRTKGAMIRLTGQDLRFRRTQT